MVKYYLVFSHAYRGNCDRVLSKYFSVLIQLALYSQVRVEGLYREKRASLHYPEHIGRMDLGSVSGLTTAMFWFKGVTPSS